MALRKFGVHLPHLDANDLQAGVFESLDQPAREAARYNDDEPTPEELTAIERESGLIAAEMALLDAEIRILAAEDDASDIDGQRLRRTLRDVVRENSELFRDEFDEDSDDDAA